MALRLARYAAVAALAAAAFFVPAARAAPPANDNRADALPVPTFPATLGGTTVDATLERLDPQVSQCGQIDHTVWYRIDPAPDGAITLAAQGLGLTTTMRVYRSGSSGLSEIDCATASAPGGRAQVTMQSVRGAAFFIIVGVTPGTQTGAFSLDVKLALPPANDSWRNPQRLGAAPAKVAGSLLGATSESTDPAGCSLAGPTVWYLVTANADGRLGFRISVGPDTDVVVAVQRRVRTTRQTMGCVQTGDNGVGALPVDVVKGGTYLVAVGTVEGSSPGDFALNVLKGQPLEVAPGTQLHQSRADSTVNGLTDINDMWWKVMQRGETYRIAFTSTNGCARLRMVPLRNVEVPLGDISCGGYREFTPGPDGGGKYIFEVVAAKTTATQAYHLEVARAGLDDLGVGLPLPNLTTRHGSLSTVGVDQVDRYHFAVVRRADVRIALAQPSTRPFLVGLATDDGRQLGWNSSKLSRMLEPGRYVLAVAANHDSGVRTTAKYAVSLVIRALTQTTLTLSSKELRPHVPLSIHVATQPAPDGGVIEIQVDRFDPWTGWSFYRLVRLHGPATTLTWTPPTLGRWRIRATYVGNRHFSESRTEYSTLLVAEPLR